MVVYIWNIRQNKGKFIRSFLHISCFKQTLTYTLNPPLEQILQLVHKLKIFQDVSLRFSRSHKVSVSFDILKFWPDFLNAYPLNFSFCLNNFYAKPVIAIIPLQQYKDQGVHKTKYDFVHWFGKRGGGEHTHILSMQGIYPFFTVMKISNKWTERSGLSESLKTWNNPSYLFYVGLNPKRSLSTSPELWWLLNTESAKCCIPKNEGCGNGECRKRVGKRCTGVYVIVNATNACKVLWVAV